MNATERERAATLEESKGNVAIANGLVLKAHRHFRIADAIRRNSTKGATMEAANLICKSSA